MQEHPDTPDFRFHLDTPVAKRLQGDEYYIAGWFLPEADSEAKLILEIDGRERPVETGFPRPDVARHISTPQALHCGFVARFQWPKLAPVVRLKVRSQAADLGMAREISVPPLPDRNAQSGLHKLASNYPEWLDNAEPKLFWPPNEVSKRIFALAWLPTIHVLLRFNFQDAYFVESTIRSVREQHYANWVLTVLDPDISDTRARAFIHKSAAEDARILILSESQGWFVDAFNSAIQNSTAEFVTLLEVPDELHPFALVEVARHLSDSHQPDLIYTDEDRIDSYGRRCFPQFKPDFDWETFRSYNCLSRMTVLRRSLALEVGGVRALGRRANDVTSYEWDLLLRASEALSSSKILHIQKPLYHRRMFGQDPGEDQSGGVVERKLLMKVASDHVSRSGIRVATEPGLFFPLIRSRVQHETPGKAAIITRCEDGMFQQSTVALNVHERIATLYELMNCLLYRDESGGKRMLISNLQDIREDVFVFINGSLEMVSQCFCEELVAQARRLDCGIVGGISVDLSLRVLASGFVRNDSGELVDPYMGMEFSDLPRVTHLNVARSVEAVSPHFFAVSREALSDLGGVSAVSGAEMPRLVARLVNRAHARSQRVLVTPFAIATFENTGDFVPMEIPADPSKSWIKPNRNLEAFESISAVFNNSDD